MIDYQMSNKIYGQPLRLTDTKIVTIIHSPNRRGEHLTKIDLRDWLFSLTHFPVSEAGRLYEKTGMLRENSIRKNGSMPMTVARMKHEDVRTEGRTVEMNVDLRCRNALMAQHLLNGA